MTAFHHWRRSRPFWGGVFTILAGIELYAITAVPLQLLLIQGVAGVSALVLCVLMIALAVVTWVQPNLRLATGVTVIVLSIASVLLTNLGGFLLGMLLGIHGGAGIASWRPVEKDPARPPRGGTGTPRPGVAFGLGTLFVLAAIAVTLTPNVPATADTGAAAAEPAEATPGPTATAAAASRSPSPTSSPTGSPSPTPSPTGSPSPTAEATCAPGDVPSAAELQTSRAAQDLAVATLTACQTAGRRLTVAAQAPRDAQNLVGAPVATKLTATKHELWDLKYDGIVTLRTSSGTQRALSFRASKATLQGLRQEVKDSKGTVTLSAPKTVTLSGNVRLFVLSLSGKAFGILPLQFTTDSPPLVVLPYMMFTDVDARTAVLVSDTLTTGTTTIVVG